MAECPTGRRSSRCSGAAPANPASPNHMRAFTLRSGLWACACLHGATHVACIFASVWLRVYQRPSGASVQGLSNLSQPSASLPEPVLMSLRPGAEPLSPQPLPSERTLSVPTAPTSPHLLNQTGRLLAEDGRGPFSLPEEKAPRWAAEHRLEEKKTWLTDGFDIFECPPPKTENEVRTRWGWVYQGWGAAGVGRQKVRARKMTSGVGRPGH